MIGRFFAVLAGMHFLGMEKRHSSQQVLRFQTEKANEKVSLFHWVTEA